MAGMLVEWKQLRAGSRRVTGLEFRMAPDPQGKLDMGLNDDGADHEHSDADQAMSD